MVRAMLALIALALGAGSAAMSLVFASTLGTGWIQLLWMVVAGAACATKLTFPAAWARKGFRASIMLYLVFAIALVIDSSFTGGFTATTRDALTADKAKQANIRNELKDRSDKAKQALDVTPAGRGKELIAADLEAARRLTRGCKAGTNEAKGEACANVSALEKALAQNAERARLQSEYDEANARFEATPEVIVYPEAHRLAGTVRQIGWPNVTDEGVSLFLSLLLVLFFELGSVTAARAALLKDVAKSEVSLNSHPRVARTPRQAPKPRSNTDHTPAVLAALSAAAAGKSVPGIQRDTNGTLHLSQRALHEHLRVPQRALRSAIVSLENAGRAHVAKGPGGTAIKLLGKSAAAP